MTGPGDRLAEVLQRGRTLGAVGARPDAELIGHSRAFSSALGELDGPLLDLGSGGGLPGLVIALDDPTLQVTLLERQQRRADHLRWAVGALDLADRVSVVGARAEVAASDPGHRGRYQAVTARSFGPPAITAECASPFLMNGGRLVVSEPPAADTDRWVGVDVALPLGRNHDKSSAFRRVFVV